MRTSARSMPLISIDAVVLDTETTGLDARAARLVQIGALRLSGGSLTADGSFEKLVNPGQSIPQSAIAVHGITDAMVAGVPPFTAVAPMLEAFVGTAIVIGHTIHYDLAVLKREYALAERQMPRFRTLDVRTLAQLAAPTLADYGLERLCEWLSVTIVNRHTAIGDARAAGEVFLALVPLLRAKGIRTLAEAEAGCRTLVEREATASARAVLPSSSASTPVSHAVTEIDNFLYRHRVSDIMSAPPVFASPETSLRNAVHLLIEEKVSSVFVQTDSGEIGIVTERDVLRALNEGGESSLTMPIKRIANAPLHTVTEGDFLYRAIGRIQRMGFRHLGVKDASGKIVGAVTSRNLLRHRTTAAIVLGDEIDNAATSPALAAAWAQLPLVAKSLIDEKVDSRIISAVISAEICATTRRAAELAELRMQRDGAGGPPVPFAVLVLGSAGRTESQLAADQDNAIVYTDGTEGGPEDRYFEMLARHMTETLDAAGVPLCKGGVMARNRAWRKSVSDWQATIDAWVRHQRPEDILNVDIFFDAVPVYGETRLAEIVREHAYTRGHAARDFQNLMIETTRKRGRAFTLFGKFRTDTTGRIDLKRHGLMPIFTAARILSIKHNVRARSTAERLWGVVAKGVIAPDTVDAILDAQQTLLAAVIAQQLMDTQAGVLLSTKVAPNELSKVERGRLKAALQAVDTAVELVAEGRV